VAVGEAVGANGLQGLVNNAGIGMGVPVEFFPGMNTRVAPW
jgi:hypothetical protein